MEVYWAVVDVFEVDCGCEVIKLEVRVEEVLVVREIATFGVAMVVEFATDA